jgi:hypothetical protein
MTKKLLPKSLEDYLDRPYGGLFGNSALTKIVEEIVADPDMDYRPKYLEEVTGMRSPTVRDALKTLVRLGLLKNISADVQHPVYRVIVESKKFVALSFLAYAVLDDREGSDCMDTAILDYYHNDLIIKDKALTTPIEYNKLAATTK